MLKRRAKAWWRASFCLDAPGAKVKRRPARVISTGRSPLAGRYVGERRISSAERPGGSGALQGHGTGPGQPRAGSFGGVGGAGSAPAAVVAAVEVAGGGSGRQRQRLPPPPPPGQQWSRRSARGRVCPIACPEPIGAFGGCRDEFTGVRGALAGLLVAVRPPAASSG